MRPDEIEKIKTEICEIRSFGLSYKKRYGPKNAVYKTCHKAAKRIDSLLKELMAKEEDRVKQGAGPVEDHLPLRLY